MTDSTLELNPAVSQSDAYVISKKSSGLAILTDYGH